MPKYCPKCGHNFPDDWDECNECEVELIFEEKDRVLYTSNVKYIDIKPYEQKQPQNIPKCPTCGSTNIRRITTSERAGNAIMWGLFGNKRKCQFECLNSQCKYRW